jgi:hypothetical protein
VLKKLNLSGASLQTRVLNVIHGTRASAKVLKFKNEIAIGAEASYLVARKTRAFYGDSYRHKKHCPNFEIKQ